MDYLMIVGGKRAILNQQYSKIGMGYPRVFVEISDTEYVNIDITLGAAFNMPAKNFEDWLQDAKLVDEEKGRELLEENNINYDIFVQAVASMSSENNTII